MVSRDILDTSFQRDHAKLLSDDGRVPAKLLSEDGEVAEWLKAAVC